MHAATELDNLKTRSGALFKRVAPGGVETTGKSLWKRIADIGNSVFNQSGIALKSNRANRDLLISSYLDTFLYTKMISRV